MKPIYRTNVEVTAPLAEQWQALAVKRQTSKRKILEDALTAYFASPEGKG